MFDSKLVRTLQALVIVLFALVFLGQGSTSPIGAQSNRELGALVAQAQAKGHVRVIVGVRVPTYKPEGRLDVRAAQAQRASIAQAQNALLNQLAVHNVRVMRRFTTIPYLALEVNANALNALARAANVANIREDKPRAPSLSESTVIVGATSAWASG
ncbi:MAG: hypothetical protein N2559_09875, partial [Anaerolineae bacterium]|nr:hypothetical protein [Anaerolineae bacterium]